MESNFMTIVMQLLKTMEGGSSHDSTRRIIQEELRRSQNQENNDALKRMLQIIEQKHAVELQEASREKEMYKIQAELYKKQLQELSREKKSEDKTERMKDLLNHLAELSINKQEHQAKPYPKQEQYGKTNHNPKNPQKGKGTNSEGPLPWMDNPKGNFQTKSQPDQSFHHRSGDHFKKNIQHNDGQNGNSNQRHHYSNRGGVNRGRGQRGSNHRGRGRSASLGRNQYAAQQDNASGTSNTGAPQATTSFHVQVTKNIGEQWQWVSNEDLTGAAQQQHGKQGQFQGRGRARGRGNGRGHGRGRGQGQTHFQTHGNQRNIVKKNRQQTQSGKQDEESEDCVIS